MVPTFQTPPTGERRVRHVLCVDAVSDVDARCGAIPARRADELHCDFFETGFTEKGP